MSIVMKTCPHCRRQMPCVDGMENETHHDWRGCVSSLAALAESQGREILGLQKQISLVETKLRHATDKILILQERSDRKKV